MSEQPQTIAKCEGCTTRTTFGAEISAKLLNIQQQQLVCDVAYSYQSEHAHSPML